jgi:hypothetical protein
MHLILLRNLFNVLIIKVSGRFGVTVLAGG